MIDYSINSSRLSKLYIIFNLVLTLDTFPNNFLHTCQPVEETPP